MFTCSQDGAGYLDSLKIYHVAASKQCGAGGGGLAFTSSGVSRHRLRTPAPKHPLAEILVFESPLLSCGDFLSLSRLRAHD